MMRNALIICTFFIVFALAGYGAGMAAHSIYLRVHEGRSAVAVSGSTDEIMVVPLGMAIGVRINTNGVMVLGTGAFTCADGISHRPADNVLQAGDLILAADGVALSDKEHLASHVAESVACVTFTVLRDEREMEFTITPVAAAQDDIRRIGAWVRDSTKGIGTLTFVNPEAGTFGALGHGIMDVDTRKLMSVRTGQIMPNRVTGATRGMRGAPGELKGEVDTSETLGEITANIQGGIYGTLSPHAQEKFATQQAISIATRAQIQAGPATILTTVAGTDPREYEIMIENIARNPSCETKALIIRITDPALIALTGGIVQGMSGSPILQNGRIVGAVTHVFVQDPTKGYGILIESMLKLLVAAAY
jgi:stage IV sporulation protein B